MATSNKTNLKTLYFDIETTGFKADWSQLLCVAYQIDDEPVQCIEVTEWGPEGDHDAIEMFVEQVLQRDDIGLMVTHNGTGFDIPYLKTKMAKYNLGAFPAIASVDTLFVARHHFRALSSRRLDRLAGFLGCHFKKSGVDPELWRAAAFGDQPAMQAIVKHCIADIRVLHWVYKKIRPFMARHPRLGDTTACKVCQGHSFQSRGHYTTRTTGVQLRFVCNTCGAWDHTAEKKAKKK